MNASTPIYKLARFCLTTADAPALATFYETAFGFHRISSEHLAGSKFSALMNVPGGADRITLGLGHEIVELLQFDCPGQPYPAKPSASDLIFQHFAIVAADMTAAWRRLQTVRGWSAITRDYPQRLPESSGGVTAFKFRDPEGHPLELLAFPVDGMPQRWQATSEVQCCLGIDHSAISVSDTTVSTAFYNALGLHTSGRSFNQGPEQEALDAVPQVQVKVTSLSALNPTPHIELLCYHNQPYGIPIVTKSNDIAATRLVVERDVSNMREGDIVSYGICDPDAHHLTIISPA